MTCHPCASFLLTNADWILGLCWRVSAQHPARTWWLKSYELLCFIPRLHLDVNFMLLLSQVCLLTWCIQAEQLCVWLGSVRVNRDVIFQQIRGFPSFSCRVFSLWACLIQLSNSDFRVFGHMPITSLSKVCQMLSWWTKELPHSNSIWDTIINVVPLCSVYETPSYESNLTLLASLLIRACYLFFRWSACSADHLKNK